MGELVLVLLTWIVGQTGLAMPPPPRLVLQSAEQMNERILGNTDVSRVRALYDRKEAIVYVRNDWDAADLRSRAGLLHELVHHVQAFNKVPARCPAEHELQAYHLTFKWLREQGVQNPYAFMGIDEFTVRVLSMCPE